MSVSKTTKLPFRIKINLTIIFITSIALFIGSLFFSKKSFLVGVTTGDNLTIEEEYEDNPAYIGSYEDGTRSYNQIYSVYTKDDICPCQTGDIDCEHTFLCLEDKNVGRNALTYNLDTAPSNLLDEATKNLETEEVKDLYRTLHGATLIIAPRKTLYLVTSAIMKVLSFLGFILCVVYYNHVKALQ